MISFKKKSKYSAPIVKKRIDDRTEFYPPLDYSFYNAIRIEDAISHKPRSSDVIKQGDQYYSYGINLNHNRLNGNLDTFPKIIRNLLIDPNVLSSLDLSFNTFTEVPLAITQVQSLKYFYFHKNQLNDRTEIDKLRLLTKLKCLTLQGNPIEKNIPYLHSYVLYLIPNLKYLNCTSITKADLQTSHCWKDMNPYLLPKIINK